MSGRTLRRPAPTPMLPVAVLAMALALGGCGEESKAPPRDAPGPAAEGAGPAEPSRMLGADRLAEREAELDDRQLANRTGDSPGEPPAAQPVPLAPFIGRWAPSPEACSLAALTVNAVSIVEGDRTCAISSVATHERVVDMLAFLDAKGIEATIEGACPEPGHAPRRWMLFVAREDPDSLEVTTGDGRPVILGRCPP